MISLIFCWRGGTPVIVLAITQMLGVGATTLISHTAGRREREQARDAGDRSSVAS